MADSLKRHGSRPEPASALTPADFRERLLAKKAELLSGGAGRRDSTGAVQAADDDQGPILHEQFISLRVQHLDYRTIKAIDAALDRLDSGDFGLCCACGEPISAKRLAAIPWAERCIGCQERALDEEAA